MCTYSRLKKRFTLLMVSLFGYAKTIPKKNRLVRKMTQNEKVTSILAGIRNNPVERHEPILEKGSLIFAANADSRFGDVEVIRRIGLGTHAEVYEVSPVGSSFSGGLTFAMKVEKPIKQALGLLKKEIETLRALSHLSCVPSILGEYCVEIDSTKCFAFGLEQFNSSLSAFKQLSRSLDGAFFHYLYHQMFSCISTIHEAGYIHRDIKPSNFMFKLSDCLRVVLIDFGSSVKKGEPAVGRGTGAYLPPFDDREECVQKDDYWAMAFSLLDLAIGGGLPWRSTSARTLEGRVEIKKAKISLLNNLNNTEIPSLVRQILHNLHAGEPLPRVDTPTDNSVMLLFQRTISGPLKNISPIALLNGERRSEILAQKFSRNVLLPFVCEPFGQVVAMHRAQRMRICVSQLVCGVCDLSNCPLLHYTDNGGIFSSAINRWFRERNCVCLSNFVGGKCKKSCSKIHLTISILEELYVNNRIHPDVVKI